MTAPTVADLKAGDRVRVRIEHVAEPVVGTLRGANPHLVWATGNAVGAMLILDLPAAYIVRDSQGLPGGRIRSVELWGDETAADNAAELAQRWCALKDESRRLPKADRDAMAGQVQDALDEFLAACKEVQR